MKRRDEEKATRVARLLIILQYMMLIRQVVVISWSSIYYHLVWFGYNIILVS